MPIPSRKIALGGRLPWFRAVDLHGTPLNPLPIDPLDDNRSSGIDPNKPVIVAFICNHSPYVQAVQPVLAQVLNAAMEDFTVIAISSNDTDSYPNDNAAEMAKQAQAGNFRFPYCLDEDQEIAKAFGASCTPEFFVYNSSGRLVYHGQFDDSRPENSLTPSGESLTRAIEAVRDEGRQVDRRRGFDKDQPHAFGCSIKWKSGNEPEYAFASTTVDWLTDF